MTAPNLILYQRDDCHLCDLALGVLAQARVPAFDSVFIDNDAALEAHYGIRVPVLRDVSAERELAWPFDAARLRVWLASAALLALPLGAGAAPAGLPSSAPARDVQAGDVDFANTGSRSEAGSAWIGMQVTDVVPAASIERIVLIKAVTSASSDVDLRSIRRMLGASSAPLRAQDVSGAAGLLQLGNPTSIWEGLLLLRSGDIIGFVIDSERLCLRGAAGDMGCWSH